MTNWNMPYWQTKQTKDYQNKLRGARSKAMGDAWEVMLSNACDAYRKAGIADIQKTPEPFRVTRNLGKGRFEGHFIHCAQPDYKGTQSKNFERFQILGGLAYVMVCIQLKDFYRVPWNIWKSMKQLYGHKYMTSSDLEIYKVPCRENFVEILKGIENERN